MAVPRYISSYVEEMSMKRRFRQNYLQCCLVWCPCKISCELVKVGTTHLSNGLCIYFFCCSFVNVVATTHCLNGLSPFWQFCSGIWANNFVRFFAETLSSWYISLTYDEIEWLALCCIHKIVFYSLLHVKRLNRSWRSWFVIKLYDYSLKRSTWLAR